MSSRILISKKKATPRHPRRMRNPSAPLVIVAIVAIILMISAGSFFLAQKTTSTNSTAIESNKRVILYVNQGNALVSTANYTALLNYAKSNNFNTIFFQVYRNGELLFSQSNLTYFVETAHIEKLKIFFALYFTSSSQQIPASIYGLGEDGINLDMSTLSSSAQNNLLSTLRQNYNRGETAVTSTNFATTLKPDLLILETYLASDKLYIHPGIIASVEPLATSSKQDYETQYQYALANSDGIMVFDYYGLLRTGY
ncbi:MAG: hypothetical protein ACREBS_07940 [Nitrososphaerales archaeon]